MIEHERLDLDAGNRHETETTSARWSNYLTANIVLNERTRCGTTTYFQPKINDFGDIRILSDTDVQIGLTRQLSFAISFRIRYDTEQPDKIESMDTALKTGLVFSF